MVFVLLLLAMWEASQDHIGVTPKFHIALSVVFAAYGVGILLFFKYLASRNPVVKIPFWTGLWIVGPRVAYQLLVRVAFVVFALVYATKAVTLLDPTVLAQPADYMSIFLMTIDRTFPFGANLEQFLFPAVPPVVLNPANHLALLLKFFPWATWSFVISAVFVTVIRAEWESLDNATLKTRSRATP